VIKLASRPVLQKSISWRLTLTGTVSALLTSEFWIHLSVPFLRQKVRFPMWPTGAAIELLVAAGFGAIAAVRGSRLWWISVICALFSLGFLIFLLGG